MRSPMSEIQYIRVANNNVSTVRYRTFVRQCIEIFNLPIEILERYRTVPYYDEREFISDLFFLFKKR